MKRVKVGSVVKKLVKKMLLAIIFVPISFSYAEDTKKPGVIKKKYTHSCPAGTIRVGETPKQSTPNRGSVVFCKQELINGQRLQGDFASFYQNGNKRREGEYNGGKKEGTWIDYYKSGEISQKKEYSTGKIIKTETFDKKGREINNKEKNKGVKIKAETAYQELSKAGRYSSSSSNKKNSITQSWPSNTSHKSSISRTSSSSRKRNVLF